MKIGQKQDEDLKELKTFPKQVIEAMLIEQERQTGKKDVAIFQDFRVADAEQGGFTWKNTSMGFSFWNDIINLMDFDLFFKEYKQ